MNTYLCVYLGASYVGLFLTPIVIWLAHHVKAVDQPGARSVHQKPIPRIGGIAIFIPTMIMINMVIFLNNGVGQAFKAHSTQLYTLLGCALCIFLVGLIDDFKNLPARVKFLAQFVAAITLCISGVRIESLSITPEWTLPLGQFGCVLTVLWIVGITNAVNLSDGLDGLAAGVATIACGTITVFAISRGDVVMAVFMLALLGSLTGFLIFNFNPAKVFMGDCGSLFLGFIIASSSVMCVSTSTALVGLTLPALALGVPIFDTLFSMLRRYLERRSLFAPDRSHIHHLLLDRGLGQRQVVGVIYCATVLVSGLGLFMLIQEDIGAILIFVFLLVVLMLMFRVVGVVRIHEVLDRVNDKQKLSKKKKHTRKVFESTQLQFRRVENTEQWWKTLCQAGQSLDFAWINAKRTYVNGNSEEEIWRNPATPPEVPQIIEMSFPFHDAPSKTIQEYAVAIYIKDTLEEVGHRASLFGRLLDEHETQRITLKNCQTVRP